MFACPLCNEWLYVNSLCEDCKITRNIVRCYGIEKVNRSLITFFLREDDKIENKVNNEKKCPLTRSKAKKDRKEGVKGLDGEL